MFLRHEPSFLQSIKCFQSHGEGFYFPSSAICILNKVQDFHSVNTFQQTCIFKTNCKRANKQSSELEELWQGWGMTKGLSSQAISFKTVASSTMFAIGSNGMSSWGGFSLWSRWLCLAFLGYCGNVVVKTCRLHQGGPVTSVRKEYLQSLFFFSQDMRSRRLPS